MQPFLLTELQHRTSCHVNSLDTPTHTNKMDSTQRKDQSSSNY